MLRSNPKADKNTKFGEIKKQNLDDEKETTISDTSDINSQYDLSQINQMKEKMKETAKFMLNKLDSKHDSLKKVSYYPCYDQKCGKLYDSLMSQQDP